jgi:hypothetical protein
MGLEVTYNNEEISDRAVAQMVELQPSKCEVLRSKPQYCHKNKQTKEV